ncbi:MAG TPA: sigma-70 family RNA polymerase sigma factor [Candidatus Lustribacter sp.]|nr:sigma-70 family RNA polymerase sigma factor [Candidatus Lustribacter sp.]
MTSARGLPPDVEALLTTVYEAESARLVSFARLFVDDRTAAEDLVQEAFIRLARSAHRIRDPSRCASYVRSIVVNLARDHNRRGLVSLRHRPSAAPDERSAEEEGTLRARDAAVIQALRGLPRRQRDCVALRYFHELGIPEIAQTLAISPNSVKTHLSRGLAALARSLGEAP